ncbi:putative F-box/LRR protein [Trifolium pratense]|uniref:Putative F-box/LRR protein n=1 Tax=Trifolium pratense TaxID=57577 RepID=A0A2K3MBJ2_TRIPR|nr:putative F-box/LRR protein [Trifolium pratense]
MVSSYILPEDCWESIFKFIINDDDDYYYNINLRSLSLVSKQFLSITNRLFLFSLTLSDESKYCRLLQRFTNLNSLKLTGEYTDLDNLLIEISSFPLKQLTSLDLSNQPTIPAIGLRAFSKKITTLTSLTCSYIDSINTSDLFLIAECFPLLQELNFSYPCPSILENGFHEDCSSYVDGIEAISLALIKLRKDLLMLSVRDRH